MHSPDLHTLLGSAKETYECFVKGLEGLTYFGSYEGFEKRKKHVAPGFMSMRSGPWDLSHTP